MSSNKDGEDDSEIEEDESGFGIIESDAFPNKIHLNLVEWCPVYDLVSVVFQIDETVAVYRIPGGNKVFETKFAHDAKSCVARVAWRSDGKSIIVALQNGLMRCFSVDNGKLENIVVADSNNVGSSLPLGLVYWAEIKSQQDPDHALPEDNCSKILSSLPRLPPVTASTGSTIAVSEPAGPSNDSTITPILLANYPGSQLRIYLMGHLFLGSVQLVGEKEDDILVQEACIVSSDCSQQCLITRTSSGTVSVTPVNLRFIPKSGPYLDMVGGGLMQTRELLVYMEAALKAIWGELDTLTKANKEITGPLEQATSQEMNIEAWNVLYELLITGCAEKVVREWFSHHINDKGLKKWRKVATTCYEQVRKHIWELVLPATQRLIVILSNLEGLALWPQRGGPLGLESKEIARLIDQIELILQGSYEMLGEINKEYMHFTEFHHWVRGQFDENNESGTNGEDDNTTVNVGKVAYYLKRYFSMKKGDNETRRWKRLDEIMKTVQESARLVEKGPFEAMIEEVVIGKSLVILDQDQQNALVTTTTTNGDNVLVVAVAIETEVWIIEFSTRLNPGTNMLMIDDDVIRGAARFETPSQKKIVGVEFINDGKVLLLLKGDRGSSILSFEYPSQMEGVSTTEEKPGVVNMHKVMNQLQKDVITPIQSRDFESTYDNMAVNSRVSRRIGCLIGNDLRSYLVFDIDEMGQEDQQQGGSDDILDMPIDKILAMAI